MTERIIHTAVPTALPLNSNSLKDALKNTHIPRAPSTVEMASRREHKVLPGGDAWTENL